MAGACPAGAVPNSRGQSTQFVWVGLATFAASRLPEWTRLNPWIVGAIANNLVNVAALCSSNPPVPPVVTPADIATLPTAPFGGLVQATGAIEKITQALYYDAFQTLCVCNPTSGACTQTVDINLGTNACWTTGGNGSYVWPAALGDGSCTGPNEWYPLSTQCAGPMDFTLWMEPRTSAQPGPFNYSMYDCNNVFSSGAIKGGQEFAGTYTGHPGCSSSPGIRLLWGINDGGARTHWSLDISPGGGQGGTPFPPPVQPPDTTTPVPTPPALPCDSATQCNVWWGVSYQTQTNVSIANQTNVQVTEGLPTSYATGNSFQLSGQGVQVVAQDTLGVAVQLDTVPPTYSATATNPPRYYDIGWIMMGAADALDGKKWLHSSGDRFIPAFPEIDRVHYNLSDGVTITLTELVPPAPASS